MSARHPSHRRAVAGPSQRQLRAGELVRHALVDILRHETLDDPALEHAVVTVSEVRMSPDLAHATCFVEPLRGEHAPEIVAALNRSAKFLRGRLGHVIAMRLTPDLKFRHDDSFDEAEHIARLLEDPRVRRDLEASPSSSEEDGEEA